MFRSTSCQLAELPCLKRKWRSPYKTPQRGMCFLDVHYLGYVPGIRSKSNVHRQVWSFVSNIRVFVSLLFSHDSAVCKKKIIEACQNNTRLSSLAHWAWNSCSWFLPSALPLAELSQLHSPSVHSLPDMPRGMNSCKNNINKMGKWWSTTEFDLLQSILQFIKK